MRVDAAVACPAGADARGASQPLGEAPDRAADFVDLGVGERRERRGLETSFATIEGELGDAGVVRMPHVGPDIVLGAGELTPQGVGEHASAVAEGVHESGAEARQRLASASCTQLARSPVGEVAEHQAAVGVDRLRDPGPHQQAVEIGPPVEEGRQPDVGPAARELGKKRAQCVELAGGEALRLEALPQGAPSRAGRSGREERGEGRVEAWSLAGAAHDEARHGLAEERAVPEAGELDGPSDVDRLRRGDREPLTPQGPEQLVEYAHQSARIQGHGDSLAPCVSPPGGPARSPDAVSPPAPAPRAACARFPRGARRRTSRSRWRHRGRCRACR